MRAVRARIAVVLAVALALVGGAAAFVTYSRAQAARPVAHATLPVRPDSYLGVYEHGSPPPFTAVQDFGQAAGHAPDLAGYFSGWGQPFETGFASTARAHGMTVLVQIDPTGASVAGIAAGKYDAWLRSYADSVRDFGHAVVLGFGHEMNAAWYGWGYHHVSPATFIAAWRHVVTLFRGAGADNVTWLWTVQGDVPGTGPVRDWWPGRQYVTWVGVDAYFYRRSDTFQAVFGQTITQIRDFTRRPVLLSETSVGPAAGQPAKIAGLFRGMAADKALGLVWFDISQHDGIYHQDWRLEDNQAAEAAFRRSAAAYLAGNPG
jgi:mannan endo-1,4-beta-mannosidase